MFEFTRTGCGEPLNGLVTLFRIGILGINAVINHFTNQPVAYPTGMDDDRVDSEPLHQAVNDGEPGDDDVGSVCRHARH